MPTRFLDWTSEGQFDLLGWPTGPPPMSRDLRMKMISNIVIVLANLEAIWLYYVLTDGIRHYNNLQTGLTWLAGFQIIVSGIVASACLLLARKQGKYEFQKWAFAATGFAILGLCAAIIGAYPFLIGKFIP